MKYFIKTPWWLKKIYSSCLWSLNAKEKAVYLTFDDGPHAVATTFVLDQLKKYDAKATFFCIGKNVLAEPQVYKRILDEGHAVGNHTHHHLNGWKTNNEVYLSDIHEASKYIDSILFRPPYGRITFFQARNVKEALKKNNAKIIMWDVISGDFDESLNGEQCLQNIIMNATSGSIIVLHDSQKAFPRLEYALPLALSFFIENGYQLKKLDNF